MEKLTKDYVVTGIITSDYGRAGNYSERYDYIITATNKPEAKRIFKSRHSSAKKVTASLASDYKYLDPYTTFERFYK